MHMLAALDLATGKLYYRIRTRKRWRRVPRPAQDAAGPLAGREAVRDLRQLLPAQATPSVRAWCAANDVELVFLPTYGSWLNWIEAEFAALRYFALNGTDHRSHAEQNAAIGCQWPVRSPRWRPGVLPTGGQMFLPDGGQIVPRPGSSGSGQGGYPLPEVACASR